MRYAVKGFLKVKIDDICLVTVGHSILNITKKQDKLLSSRSMLEESKLVGRDHSS